MLGAATRVRSTSGVSARPTLDEQSFFISKTGVPCYRGQQLRNNILVKLLLALVAGHSFCVILSFQRPVESGPACQSLSYKERWHASGVTERLYKDEPALCSKARLFTPYCASGV